MQTANQALIFPLGPREKDGGRWDIHRLPASQQARGATCTLLPTINGDFVQESQRDLHNSQPAHPKQYPTMQQPEALDLARGVRGCPSEPFHFLNP
jgi:hypothetical protein